MKLILVLGGARSGKSNFQILMTSLTLLNLPAYSYSEFFRAI
jgi:hypothetical protein